MKFGLPVYLSNIYLTERMISPSITGCYYSIHTLYSEYYQALHCGIIGLYLMPMKEKEAKGCQYLI